MFMCSGSQPFKDCRHLPNLKLFWGALQEVLAWQCDGWGLRRVVTGPIYIPTVALASVKLSVESFQTLLSPPSTPSQLFSRIQKERGRVVIFKSSAFPSAHIRVLRRIAEGRFGKAGLWTLLHNAMNPQGSLDPQFENRFLLFPFLCGQTLVLHLGLCWGKITWPLAS